MTTTPTLRTHDLDDGDAKLIMPNGLNIMVTRVPLAFGEDDYNSNLDHTQLTVSVNTEDMEQDHDDGTPIMQVLLNDATLYDVEPGPNGSAVVKIDAPIRGLGQPEPDDLPDLDPYEARNEAIKAIGEDRVPSDVLREIVRDFGDQS
jgi:hypothetical protein